MEKRTVLRDNSVELQLRNFLLSKKDQLQNNPELILKAIDEFDLNKLLVNIGPLKGETLKSELKASNPETVVEFGTYVGYSAILIASTLRNLSFATTSKVYTFESDPVLAEISTDIIELAGLSDQVVQIIGRVNETAELLLDTYHIESIDFIVLDHFRSYYLPDLRVIESLELISPGSVMIANNVVNSGAEDYVEYIKSAPMDKRNYNSTVKNIFGRRYCGKWGLLYESVTVLLQHSHGEVDGLEITKCVGLLD